MKTLKQYIKEKTLEDFEEDLTGDKNGRQKSNTIDRPW